MQPEMEMEYPTSKIHTGGSTSIALTNVQALMMLLVMILFSGFKQMANLALLSPQRQHGIVLDNQLLSNLGIMLSGLRSIFPGTRLLLGWLFSVACQPGIG
ncbi:hypothetical protein Bca52824_075011 [Brassica carinata]|uniref:Uncharacterized protein n=1 Tax=Brassica carinata TaxID=52824 RepID=A0A8X7PS25_BRACI|nr:hypothetical protein Bca52824_075011 [Brassica carinata]